MFNQDRMRGWKHGDMFLAGQEAKIVLNFFLTSEFAVFICHWLLVLPNSNKQINHVLDYKIRENFMLNTLFAK